MKEGRREGMKEGLFCNVILVNKKCPIEVIVIML